jgi:hypothetical protein
MNSTALVNELDLLSDRFYLFIVIPIRVFGSITNVINIIIFLNKELKNDIYKYLIAKSASDFIYSFILIPTFIPFSLTNRYISIEATYSFISAWYTLYIDYYFTSSLAIFSIFLETLVSLKIYIMTINIERYFKFMDKLSTLFVIILLFIISILYYIPEVIFQDIIRVQNSTNHFIVVLNQIANDTGGLFDSLQAVALLIRGPVFLALVLIINLSTWYQFKKQMNAKLLINNLNLIITKRNYNSRRNTQLYNEDSSKTISNDNETKKIRNVIRANRNITKMVISMLIIYAFGYTPYTIRHTIGLFHLDDKWPLFYYYFKLFANFLISLSHGLMIFIYFKTNKLYKKVFLLYFIF